MSTLRFRENYLPQTQTPQIDQLMPSDMRKAIDYLRWKRYLSTIICLLSLYQCIAQNPFDYMGNVKPSEVLFEIECVDTLYYKSKDNYRLIYYDAKGVFSKEIKIAGSAFYECNFKHGEWHGITVDWDDVRGLSYLSYCNLGRCYTLQYHGGHLVTIKGDSLSYGPRGPWYYYYPNGQLKLKGFAGSPPYSDTLYSYHENGLLESKGLSFGPSIGEDTRIGEWVDYFSTGQLRLRSNYGFDFNRTGETWRWKQGKWEYYDIDGELLILEQWDQGVLIERKEY
jgi:hypothetical protein